MAGVSARRPGVVYPWTVALSKRFRDSLGKATPCTAKFVLEHDGILQEAEVIWLYDHSVAIALRKPSGGLLFRRLTYDEAEFPPGSMAARGVAATKAQELFPIDEKAGKSKREKIEKQRLDYIEDHWQDFYDDIVLGMREWRSRQKRYIENENLADYWRRQWLVWVSMLTRKN